MKTVLSITGVFVCCALLLATTNGQRWGHDSTKCSIHVPVPDLTYCDSIGALEENVDGAIHESRGRIEVMKEYQQDSFKLFDQQFTSILNDSTNADSDINDIDEEVGVLKRIIVSMQNLTLNSEHQGTEVDGPETTGRERRAAAALPPAQQQLLDAAKLSFQKSLAVVLQKLQNVSQTLATEDANNVASHARLQQEMATNQKGLTILQQQISSIDTAIKAVVSRIGQGAPGGPAPTPSGSSLAGVQQSVTELIINATVAEKLAQRELDNIDNTLSQMIADEANVTASLGTISADRTQFEQNLTSSEVEVDNLVNGEKFVERQINTIIQQSRQDLSQSEADLNAQDRKLKSAAMSVAKSIIQLGQFEQDLATARQAVDGSQSLVTLTKQARQSQVFEVLKLKKALKDSINAMKYAFGLIKTLP